MPQPSERPSLADTRETTYPNLYLEHADYAVRDAMQVIVPHVAEHVAVDAGNERITFAELHARSSQVAHAALDRGLDHAEPVLILSDRDLAPAVAICGVMYAGLIGAPVDVREPMERLRRLFELSGAEWIVADRPHADLARALSDRVLVLDETASFPTDPPVVHIPLDRPGQILFTSGSTGTPKGVHISQRDLVARGGWHRGDPLLPGRDRIAVTSSWGFAAAQGRLLNGLLNGATTCLYDLRDRGARSLPEWVRDQQVTMIQMSPTVLRALAPTTPPGTMGCLRRLGFISEALQWSDVALARRLVGPDTALVNNFGASEIGLATSYPIPRDSVPDDDPVPVGLPQPSVEIQLVDDNGEPVPDGEPGRFVVIVDGPLERGYWRDPELNAATFFTLPDGRSGFGMSDRGRRRPDGLFEQLGRVDSRVKVRGAMVATSEVEVALMTLDDVADAAVIAAPDDGGATRLVAYVVAEPGRQLSGWKLRRDVARRLPTTVE